MCLYTQHKYVHVCEIKSNPPVMRSNYRVHSLCKTQFVCQLDFNTGTQRPIITQLALMLCTCWSQCHLCSLTKATLLKSKVPWLILWKPLCLCPCAKQLQLLPLARILAKYWWLLVESRPVKTIWEETSFSGDDNRAKQNHRQCGGIRTQPNLPASREQKEHQKEEGRLRQIVSKKRWGKRRQREQGHGDLYSFKFSTLTWVVLFVSCLDY